ncbi:MAG TPA: response regulator transcription factor [bacterium]|nr:response regulator transcription factor [bacterium]
MASKKQILIIDDDQKLGELLTHYLAKFDMAATCATRPEEGLSLVKRLSPQLVILDVMLPGQDGFSVCKEIRKNSKVPIIMLTARGDVTDRVVGLELGADDYLPKPFEPRELVARIDSVLRRLSPQEPAADQTLKCESLTLNLGKRQALLKGKDLSLTPTEFEILAFFMKNPGTVLNRDQIMEYLKGVECEAFNRSVDIAMSRLRKKLGDSADKPKYFKTIWGTGYLFIGKVAVHEA